MSCVTIKYAKNEDKGEHANDRLHQYSGDEVSVEGLPALISNHQHRVDLQPGTNSRILYHSKARGNEDHPAV
ncbi:hypothetical protein PGT21_005504 [Puccinia graminis f. sp. tritici]|uniref:Uncharacterized protein n=1 Tax=Puccinia graminis f. sp. tritici TaxID=56615 RepID=A0A5B0NZQ8_PUCGR|nr:hypothetical protein PGT21_005504 [Puccinia graminis f. sp. tritici]KAA1093610.1 hypothetical protein PGTUg99_007885 [Puccinia graminis f. sp. tritici]